MIRSDWFFICSILHVMAMDLKLLTHQGNEKSVNIALDTIVEFENKDNAADVQFLDNVQSFIGKVKTVIAKKNLLRRNFKNAYYRAEKFTDFILNLTQILIKYNDEDLKYFFNIVTDEMKKYHYKGCKFYELVEDYDLRKFIAGKLAQIKHTPATIMRHKLKFINNKIEEEKYNLYERELIDYINSLNGPSSIKSFNDILASLYSYKEDKSNMDLRKIIGDAIRLLVFDYYTELNRNARTALKIKLDKFYKKMIGISTFTSISTFKAQNRKNISTTKEPTISKLYRKQYKTVLQNYNYENTLSESKLTRYNERYTKPYYEKETNEDYDSDTPEHSKTNNTIETKHNRVSPNKTTPPGVSKKHKINSKIIQTLKRERIKYKTTKTILKAPKIEIAEVHKLENTFGSGKTSSREIKKAISVMKLNERNEDWGSEEQKDKVSSIPSKTETDSLEIISFDDDKFDIINSGYKINRYKKENSKQVTKKTTIKTSKKDILASKTKYFKTSKLTFMTLYPEFSKNLTSSKDPVENINIHEEMSTASKHSVKDQSINVQISTDAEHSDENRNIYAVIVTSPIPRQMYQTRTLPTEARARNIKATFRNQLMQYRKTKSTTTLENGESDEKGYIRHLIAHEKLTAFRNPHLYAKQFHKVAINPNYKKKKNSSDATYLYKSEKTIRTKIATRKILVENSRSAVRKNTKKYNFVKNLTTQTQPRKNSKLMNMYNFLIGKPQLNPSAFYDSSDEETSLRTDRQNVTESSDSKSDIFVNNHRKHSNVVENDKVMRNSETNMYNNNIYDNSSTLKKDVDKTNNLDLDKSNLTRKVFIDFSDFEVNSSINRITNEKCNNFVNKTFTMSDQEINISKNTNKAKEQKCPQYKYNAKTEQKSEQYDSRRSLLRKKIYFSYINNDIYTGGDINNYIFRSKRKNRNPKYFLDKNRGITKNGSNQNTVKIEKKSKNDKYRKHEILLQSSTKKTDRNKYSQTIQTTRHNSVERALKISKSGNNTPKKDKVFIFGSNAGDEHYEKLTEDIPLESGDKTAIELTHTGLEKIPGKELDLFETTDGPTEMKNRIHIADGIFRTNIDTNKLRQTEEGSAHPEWTKTNRLERKVTSELNIDDATDARDAKYFDPITAS